MTPQPIPQHSWINDDCQNSWIYPLTRARAEGITKIHAPCTPPCPRFETARKYLDQDPTQ
ncbi:hypothetical protein [Nocardia seriolae]|uniref:Uncharacterized protein n=1 Tax=Nocardia seriolae TaxID=37332 RepID=A0A0B8N984_9NOCA|nr:hypothetical protein [Nocardia seriolae]APA96044.1 hypothetical protein NS506_01977 [Nocardia seriolae]MTJ65875.1 hypothetical protein [Nocardia seriolae]MTJ72333.1 hypothetical protein [Nocardia seriolae]MTJ86196.1 hypothetical protein [Nocardia seriolae]MTK30192.1 hypothetical protein [Nocardia seriolae]